MTKKSKIVVYNNKVLTQIYKPLNTHKHNAKELLYHAFIVFSGFILLTAMLTICCKGLLSFFSFYCKESWPFETYATV